MQLSYSSIATYKGCPARFKYSRIDRLPDPSGPAAERGTRIHADAEAFFSEGSLPILSEELEPWRPVMQDLSSRGARPEVKFSLDKNLDPCEWEAGALRGVIDLTWTEGDTAYVIDWKTGRVRDYSDQLKMYSLALLASKPNLHDVKAHVVYIDHHPRTSTPIRMRRADLDEAKAKAKADIDRIETDKIFAPNPSPNCRWCAFRKDAGGPCRW